MNKPIPEYQLVDMICIERGIVNKNKSAFSDAKTKKRHDDIDFDKEVARINQMFLSEGYSG